MEADEQFVDLVKIMEKLRGPEGCPWDREQTHASISPYCIEEAYEVVEAIDEGDRTKLRDELGDLLLQVVFHAQLAREEGTFVIGDVLKGIREKLVRRHPHVFRRAEGDEAKTSGEVLEKWAAIKKSEGREHLLDGIPRALPALLRATRVGEKAASVGFDWTSEKEVWEKVSEEISELRNAPREPAKLEEELGDLLFALTSLARHLRVDAESSLRRAVEKFERRFRWVEKESRRESRELSQRSPEELDQLWRKAKESA